MGKQPIVCYLLLALVAGTLLASGPPAYAQPGPPYFVFNGVTHTTCTPGEYLLYAYEYHPPVPVSDPIRQHTHYANARYSWSLANPRTGTISGPFVESTYWWGVVNDGSQSFAANPRIPADTQPGDSLTVRVVVQEGQSVLETFEHTLSCTTGQPWTSADTLPGCDLRMGITARAVGGRFVQTTPAFWGPSPAQAVTPPIAFQPGDTAWVLGKDASGAYYQIVWGCDYLWVPVETMGPNPDAVWHNRALPDAIIE